MELVERLQAENARLKSSLTLLASQVDERTAEAEKLRGSMERLKLEHDALVIRLTAELVALKRQLFGPKAERIRTAEAQQSLFAILEDLGRLQRGDVAAGDRAEALVRVGEETSTHLDYRPASVIKVQVVRPKYLPPEQVGVSAADARVMAASLEGVKQVTAPNQDEAVAPGVNFIVAEPPEMPIQKGLAGPGLLALVLVMKYADHLPLFRQSGIFRRQGVKLSRSTLCDFVQGCFKLLSPLVGSMWEDAKAHSPLLLTDAAGFLVLEKERCRRGHFQVFVAPARHVLFAYLKQNNGPALAELLKGFAGKLLCDASAVIHETLRRTPAIVEVNCWAHARRWLYRALGSSSNLALVGIGFIGQLYDAHDASVDLATGLVDGRKRRELAQPILDKLKAWLASERPRQVAHSPIEVAMGYIERQWLGLTRFLDDGTLRLDNNISELELRHQKVGSKNWLFCATDGGAEWNATAVSLIASCRMHDIEPLAYLRDVLTLLPSWKKSRILELAPVNWRQTLEKPETGEQLHRLQLINYDLDHSRLSERDPAL